MGDAVLIGLPKWHLKGVKWFVQFCSVVLSNFARIWNLVGLYGLFIFWYKQANIAWLNLGLERKLADSNPWFAMMMFNILKRKMEKNIKSSAIRYYPFLYTVQVLLKRPVRVFHIIFRETCFGVGNTAIKISKPKNSFSWSNLVQSKNNSRILFCIRII